MSPIRAAKVIPLGLLGQNVWVTLRGPAILPFNEASSEDLQAVFGTRGQASRCQCQRYKLRPRESLASFPAEERAHRLRPADRLRESWVGHEQRPGRPPRRRARRLARGRAAHRLRGPAAQQSGRVGGSRGGQERRQCLGGDLLRHAVGFRKRGVSPALTCSAVDFAPQARGPRDRGLPDGDEEHDSGGAARGHRERVRRRGFIEVSRPTLRRVVMRINF